LRVYQGDFVAGEIPFNYFSNAILQGKSGLKVSELRSVSLIPNFASRNLFTG